MAARSGFTWTYDTLTPRMLGFSAAFEVALGEAVEQFAERVEEYMKDNAPWSDRTGEARDGLTAEYSESGNTHEIILYHTVDYGIWLEIRNSGEYAIILPTIEHMGPQVMAGLSMGGME